MLDFFRTQKTETPVPPSREEVIFSAFNKTHAIIEFDCTGNILDANENFLAALGYAKEEIVGRHHRLFVERSEAQSDAYRRFWHDLAAGKASTGQFKRITKSGKAIWIEATYSPVHDETGAVCGVAKIAVDITEQKMKALDNDGKTNF